MVKIRETTKGKMTLDKLADMIERTVAKKEDLEALRVEMATKIDLIRLETEIAQLSTKQDRMQAQLTEIQEMAESTDKSDLNLAIRVKKLEKHVFATP